MDVYWKINFGIVGIEPRFVVVVDLFELTTKLGLSILHFLFSIVIRNGFDIRNFFIYSLFDLVETFLAVASSSLYAVIRIIIGFGATILMFITPIYTLFGWQPLILLDFSFKAWRGLILNDSYYLNPVRILFFLVLYVIYLLKFAFARSFTAFSMLGRKRGRIF